MAASACPSPLVNLGLPRTGTTSLHLAVKQLGLRSLHASDLDAATLGAPEYRKPSDCLSLKLLAGEKKLRKPPKQEAGATLSETGPLLETC